MNIRTLTASLTAFALTACMVGSFTAFSEDEQSEIVRIMPLGDSITDGFTGDPVGGYRLTLWQMLAENGYTDNIDFVGPNWGGDGIDPNHAGYSSYAIADIPNQRSGIYNFSEWLMESYPADVVMLQIGTNDILSSYELDTIGDRLELLVDTVLNYIPEDGLLYLATIPYMDADVTIYTDAYTAEELDKAVDDYNAQIKNLVVKKQAEGKPIVLSDINSQLTKQDLLDGVHPSATGYQKMGAYWYSQLTEYLDDNTEIPTETTESVTDTTTESITDTTTEATEEITTELVTETTEINSDTETQSPAIIKGDVNLDGIVDLQDIILLQKYLLGKETINQTAFQSVDMNEDAVVNIYDLVLLKKALFSGLFT